MSLVKAYFCTAFKDSIKEEGLSFSMITLRCGITRVQISNIINHSGRNVSVDKIIEALSCLGYTTRFEISKEQEEGKDCGIKNDKKEYIGNL